MGVVILTRAILALTVFGQIVGLKYPVFGIWTKIPKI
jgi:hypothetical protein